MGLYERRKALLSPQQAIAVELVLYRDMTEREAALAMGLRATAPVSSYASQGVLRLAASWTDVTRTGEMAVA